MKYEFGGRTLYNFIWDGIGISRFSKIPMNGEDTKQVTSPVLTYVLDNTMRMLHPFMPFVTEQIWAFTS